MRVRLSCQWLSRESSTASAPPFFFPANPRLILSGLAALTLAGCAAQPQRYAGNSIDPRYGVAASPRVVAEGEIVPRGGGMYMVGKPYTVGGITYYPSERTHVAVGLASYYGTAFHGRRTANGEVFDRESISAAHPTMPLPSYARVTNLRNQSSIIVRVNDRGPYHPGRIMDVSERVAEALEFRRVGTAKVKVEYIGRAGLGGSDDHKLYATLRRDGGPAGFGPAMVAGRASNTRTADLPQNAAQPESREEQVAEITAPPPQRQQAQLQLASAPLPPARPFDLGTIPGAGVPIAPLPPHRATLAALH
ncbi:MAG: septal ring lytic transglycosylase RlpA family protein [Methylobacteriaceae bacterium]|nr:septal ring lytic transglycosylase RlpA family protein [Methylobacteriaceae bacterium]